MSDIFVSYANEDRLRVRPLVDALVQQGWTVWWDRTILPGRRWEQMVEAALAEARCVIVLWSQDSVRSSWVRVEADEGRQRGILVPALLDDVKIPLAFRELQAADLIGWRGELPSAEFNELARAVSQVLEEPSRVGDPAQSTAYSKEDIEPEGGVSEKSGKRRFPGRRHLQPRVIIAVVASLVFIGGGLWYLGPHHRPLSSVNPKESPMPAQSPERTAGENQASQSRGPVIASTPSKTVAGGNSAASMRKGSPAETRMNPKDGLVYVKIPSGKFTMGCSPGDSECEENERPSHQVTITSAFWLGQTETTVGAYRRFREPPVYPLLRAGKTLRPEWPVANVTWEESRDYCDWAGLRLPTEAEWEYAARANTTGPQYGPLNSIAWYMDNSDGILHPVGRKQPNAWDLYDMLGNAFEWVQDWYADYNSEKITDPVGPAKGRLHLVRGGSWSNMVEKGNRASYRLATNPEYRNDEFGFRCAGELP